MASNNLRNTINGLSFLTKAELTEVVKRVVGDFIGMDERVEIESWILSGISNTDPDPTETEAVKSKKDHIAKVFGWRDYDHMDLNRDEVSETEWKAFRWIMCLPS